MAVTVTDSVLMGGNPTHYDKANPIVTFLIQAVIVIVFCRILHFGLGRMRQPRVIAEVIGGILLGPTAFGRIKGFTSTIFPAAAMPNFNLVANIGLILFLFIVGLEVDLRLIRKNYRIALSVGAASLIIPFGFGCVLAWALHKEYRKTLKDDSFGVFLLFIGTAFSITAFPVLARILTELKLLRQDVGVTVLAAGVGNDVVGWILLALTIALVNSSTGLTAFYVILLVIAWTLLLFLGFKPAYAWMARRSSMESGPTDFMMTITILLVLASAFYTEIIGVHPIFGAFLVGLIIPHENNYAVRLTEKIEDLVSVLFLPLYFASSGLKTNIGLLNDGKAWGYTITIIICATFSKISGSMIAARLNGFLWRESLTVGTLMSCKGLVELIVLNVGLTAGILSEKLFTMFVIMALVTTFMTTPLVLWIFPPWYQEKVARWRSGEYDWEGHKLEKEHSDSLYHQTEKLQKVMIVVNRIEGIASLLKFTHFISFSTISIHLLRIVEMTDRLSQIIKVSESDDLLQHDSLLSIFRTMTRIVGVRMTYGLQVLTSNEYPSVIANQAREVKSELVVVPYIRSRQGEWQDNEYISTLLGQKQTNIAVLIDSDLDEREVKGLRRRTMSIGSILSRHRSDAEEITEITEPPITDRPSSESTRIFFPLFKFGPDERLGLLLLLQILENENTSASVVFFAPSTSSNPINASDALAKSTFTTTTTATKVQFATQESEITDTPSRSALTTSGSNSGIGSGSGLGFGSASGITQPHEVPDLSTDIAELSTFLNLHNHASLTLTISHHATPLASSIAYFSSFQSHRPRGRSEKSSARSARSTGAVQGEENPETAEVGKGGGKKKGEEEGNVLVILSHSTDSFTHSQLSSLHLPLHASPSPSSSSTSGSGHGGHGIGLGSAVVDVFSGISSRGGMIVVQAAL